MTRAMYWVWRRELAIMLRAPVIYVVGGLFLIVQGIAFAGLVGALSDPRRPAPLGALLEGQLAGTLLTWVLELVVLTLLGMRAIADDKRSGAWELLLTSGVGEGAAVVGKWLAATTIYALAWLPTLAYLGVVAGFRGDRGGWDAPAIVVGYAGAIALGAALLAWAIAASAAMTSALAAGALGFGGLIGLFLLGELPALWPDLAVEHPVLAGTLAACSLRGIATELARGQIALRAVVVVAGLAVVGLALAITLGCAGRRRAREIRIRAAGTAALAASFVLAGVLAARHGVALDVSAAHRNSLDPGSRAVLAELPGPASVTIVQPTLAALEPIYDEVARVAGELAGASPQLAVTRVDPAQIPGGLPEAARLAGLTSADLASGGSIVVALGGRTQVVDLLAFAALDRGADGAPVVERLGIEQAITGALAALSATQPVRLCATTGHGELALDRQPSLRDWSSVARRLRGEGMTLDAIAPGPIPAGCHAVIVAGPTSPLAPEEALAIQRHVAAGGGLVVAARVAGQGAGPGDAALPPTGLEAMLAGEGLGLAPAIAVDPSLAAQDAGGAIVIVDGYTDHPIDRGFAKARPTLWFQPRVVTTRGAARPLISASAASWGERDLVRPPAKDGDDLAGPVAIAAVGGAHRVIVIGSADSLASNILDGLGSASDLWLARAVRFASGVAEPQIAVAERAPDQVRLVMTAGQRRAVIALSVAGVPLAWIVVGGLVVWWRRRRSAR